MQRMVINKLGPIKAFELECKDFMVFTGAQASGKSTIAKSLFFFKNVKNILATLLRKRYLLKEVAFELSFEELFIRELKSVFVQTFGSSQHMSRDMMLEYFYTSDVFVRVYMKDDLEGDCSVCLDLSAELLARIQHVEGEFGDSLQFGDKYATQKLARKLNMLFADASEVVYIPAGRSMITLLSTQLNYIYSSMDDMQKRTLDYCTQSYLEKILQLKPLFQNGMKDMLKHQLIASGENKNFKVLWKYTEMVQQILEGEYRNVDGEERLQVSPKQYVKINFASSGQQEAVWILNVLFYYLLNNKKAFFIIEEPESHLFPNAQKLITELIALVKGGENQILITTHSPYILGTVNNLLYANKLAKETSSQKVGEVIAREKWLEFSELSAYYIKNGVPRSCVDYDFESIENEVIDGASDEINKDFEKMVLLKECLELETFKRRDKKNVVDKREFSL